MKLVLTIVSHKDSHTLVDVLIEKGFRATKLASTGGFLQEGNATLLIGVAEEKVDEVIDIVKSVCRSRQQVVAPITGMSGPTESYYSVPVEIPVGGATIFVLDVEKHVKV